MKLDPMDAYYDYKKFIILYVDDEEKSLKNFTRAFGSSFRILTASSAKAGLALLEQHKDEIGVLMTDQRMPGEQGVWLLERARQLQPRIIRMLVTAFTDMDAAIAAINTGAIYKYVSKPWDPPMLDTNLRRALEFFMVQMERDQLLKEKLSVIHNMLIADRLVSLGLLAQGLSHHIRNSLQAVKTFLDLAPTKLEEERLSLVGMRDPGFWQEYYRNAQSQLDKINNLLRDLWSTQDKPDFAFSDRVQVPVLVNEEVARLATILGEKKITVINDLPADLPEIAVDVTKFRRMFELLLRDEIASLAEGKEIHISGRFVPETNSGQPEVEIVVRDNGPGLPKDSLRILFDPFMVRVDAPTEYGINLMACFFIVHHHGGRIEAHSEEGQGAVFTIRMPQQPTEAPVADRREFLQKVLLNETLFHRLITSED
jgi:two-component system probable response regulator PhcQ